MQKKTTKNSRIKSKKNKINKKFENIYSPCNKREKKDIKKRLSLIFAGIFMGILNGFFGGGGGMVCVPILQNVLGLDAKQSHATAILVIFPLSLISACIYVFKGYVYSFPLISVGLGVVIGGLMGAFALKVLPPKAIRIIFAIIMFAGGVKLII